MPDITNPNCLLCGEDASRENFVSVVHEIVDGKVAQRWAHDDCSLREVLGGIGHLIAHDYWCKQMHDPNAGLTRHQSALMVRAFVEIMGVEAATERGSISS